LKEVFGGVTDIEVGPDNGYMYVLTFDGSQGTIFRVVPIGTVERTGSLENV
jgi:hypothetical protein